MFRVNLESKVIDARGVVEERYEGQSGFSSDDFVEAFADLEGEDIKIIINSAGGVVSEGLSIFNQIEARSGETTIIVDAVAASIASVITMAADTIVMRRKAQLFIHDPWTVAMGNASGFRTVADHLDALAREIADVYATRSAANGVVTDVDAWLQLMRDETWFNAEQAMSAGLADEISRPQVRTAIDEEQEDEDTRSPYSISARMTEPARAEIDLSVSDGMVEEAEKGLAWREEYNRGGTQVGVTRANQIIRDGELSEDTWKRVYSYLARHEVDKDGEGFTPDEDGFPSAGRIAWALWGGDPAFTRSRKIVEQLQREEEEDRIEPIAVLHSARVLAAVLDKRHRIMRQRLGIS